MANRNTAGLFRYNNRDRIRFLGDSERGAMTQAKTAVQGFALTHRKNACCGGEPAVANDYATIMQCRLRMKDAQDKFDGKVGIERHARLLVNANRCVAFNRKKCTKLLVG